ncbi:DUF1667 domain-containing protein [Clostridium arbusti]|uniref:DUF1667 domain-containing protein n=1 Tax=Clostridium arbusti TaxID=1137848 RepID=UPI0002882B35|nr:DUF1667 domain-containing protein [Clostridium arbusti]
MVNRLVCTVCPTSCKISIEEHNEGEYEVSGNKCAKGKSYALQEIKNPVRIFTTTVSIKGGSIKRLPVRSKEPVSKNIIEKLMKPVKAVDVYAPVKKGDIIVKNILGSGVDIVASRAVQGEDEL